MPEGLTKRLLIIEKIPVNVLLLILFTILIIFVGALTSILLFTYNATINVSQDNQRNILLNKELNNIIINNTREVPLQNREMLRDLTTIVTFLGNNFNQTFIEGIFEDREITNRTLRTIIDNQKILIEHANATSP